MKHVRLFIAVATLWLATLASWSAPAPAVPYSALATNDFRITNAIVSLRSSIGPGTNVFNTLYVTNLYTTNLFVTNVTANVVNVTSNLYVTNVTYTSNLFATNIFATNIYVTNIDASVTITTNLYVTNLFVTYEVVSNIVSGNIHGTVGTLAMFTPDEFSVGDSIVTQNTNDNNGITVNGTGNAEIDLGGTNSEKIVWGTGATNTLFRDANSLWYQASDIAPSIYPGLGVTNVTEANSALFQSGGDLAIVRGKTGVGLIDALSSGNEVRWWTKYFAPAGLADAKLGADETLTEYPWQTVNALTNTVWGFRNVSGISRLAISHSGTNGAAVFDSQSAGIAGAPRPIYFNFQGTNYAQLATNAGAVYAPNLTFLDPHSTLQAFFGLSSGGQAMVKGVGNASANAVVLSIGTNELWLLPAAFKPNPPNVVSLGTADGWWSDFFGSLHNHTPANSSETNYPGAITYDDTNLYIWTAPNVNKKVSLTSW